MKMKFLPQTPHEKKGFALRSPIEALLLVVGIGVLSGQQDIPSFKTLAAPVIDNVPSPDLIRGFITETLTTEVPAAEPPLPQPGSEKLSRSPVQLAGTALEGSAPFAGLQAWERPASGSVKFFNRGSTAFEEMFEFDLRLELIFDHAAGHMYDLRAGSPNPPPHELRAAYDAAKGQFCTHHLKDGSEQAAAVAAFCPQRAEPVTP